jgi:Kef-type K+ transport system membrane component KefB
MILLLQVTLILAVSYAARRMFLLAGHPTVVGEMLAGLLLGPSFFGWLLPRASALVFAPATLAPLNALSQLGLVLFMFLVGLRLRAPDGGFNRRLAITVSATSIVVPFVLGLLLAVSVRERLAPAGVATLPFALFIGTAMSITAFPVLARILIDYGLTTTRVGVLAITCAAFDDVTGWMILGGVTALAGGGGGRMIAGRLLLFAGYLAVMIAIVRPLLGWFVRRRNTRPDGRHADITIWLLVMLLSASATELLGVHALFGAFFAGLMMPRHEHIERRLGDSVEPMTMTLLLPLFFAFTGLRTSVQLINTTALWRDAVLILAVAIAGKGGGAIVAARVMGLSWREAGALGALLNTRGLIELVVLNVGLDFGILSPAIFSMLVLMALVTTFMTAPIVTRLLPPAEAV